MKYLSCLILILSIFKILLICPSIAKQFEEQEYARCIKKSYSLPGYDLNQSYELCYEYFSDKYNHIKIQTQPSITNELHKCTYALALAEILQKPLAMQAYGVDGLRFHDVIAYLEEYLTVLEDFENKPIIDDYELRINSRKRHSIIYKTMLTIKLDDKFPGSVASEEFTNAYEMLSSIQSQNYTATIPLYMAHLVVFHDVRPNGISAEEALRIASQLISSTYCETRNKNDSIYGKLHKELGEKQKGQIVKNPGSVYIKPSLTTLDEKQHRRIIEKEIEALKKVQQNMQVAENNPDLGQLSRKKRKLVLSDSDDDVPSEKATQAYPLEKQIEAPQHQMQVAENNPVLDQLSRKKRKLVLSDSDDDTSIDQSAQAHLMFESSFSKVIGIQVEPQLEAKGVYLDKENDGFDQNKVKKYILSQWKEGKQPDNDEIMNALGYQGKDNKRKITHYKYYLKTKHPECVPQNDLTPTQKIMNFMQQTKHPWEDLFTLYPEFNQLYPSLLKEKYFRDHGGLVRKFLARKGLIADSTKQRDTNQFNVVINFIENNPSGNFEQIHQLSPRVNAKYFYELRGIYKDYTELFTQSAKETQ